MSVSLVVCASTCEVGPAVESTQERDLRRYVVDTVSVVEVAFWKLNLYVKSNRSTFLYTNLSTRAVVRHVSVDTKDSSRTHTDGARVVMQTEKI